MAGLTALGVAVLVFGAIEVSGSPAWDYPAELRDYYCYEDGGHLSETITGTTWAAWIVLVVLAATGLNIWATKGRGSKLMVTMAWLGVAAAAVTCPVWLILGLAADCSM